MKEIREEMEKVCWLCDCLFVPEVESDSMCPSCVEEEDSDDCLDEFLN